jgi:flagellar hook-length control protein FliK
MQLPVFTSALPGTPGAQAVSGLAGASKVGSPVAGLFDLLGQALDPGSTDQGGEIGAAFAEALAGVLQLQIQPQAPAAAATAEAAADTPPPSAGSKPTVPAATLLPPAGFGAGLPLIDSALPTSAIQTAEAVPALPPGLVKDAFKDLRGKPALPGLSAPPDDTVLAQGPKATVTGVVEAMTTPAPTSVLAGAAAASAPTAIAPVAIAPAATAKTASDGQPSTRDRRPADAQPGRTGVEAALTPTTTGQSVASRAAKGSDLEVASESSLALAADTAGDGGADLPDATAPAEPPAPAGPAPAAAHSSSPMAKAEPATFIHLASQIVQKLSAKVTRFDLEMFPAGLGKVDVKVEISPSGQLTAALSFDNPQAAAELKSRADELRTALQQAGFDLKDGSLSFDFNGQQQQQRWAQERREDAQAFAGKAFAAAADKADDLLASVAEAAARLERRVAAGGLDLRI